MSRITEVSKLRVITEDLDATLLDEGCSHDGIWPSEGFQNSAKLLSRREASI